MEDFREATPTPPSNFASIFNWKHCADRRLYLDNDYAVESLRCGSGPSIEDVEQIPDVNAKPIVYHCYWFGNIGLKQAFSIKSFLCTQNLKHCKLILWLDINNGFHRYQQNIYLIPLLQYIEVRPYDPLYEAIDTPWQNHVNIPDERYNIAMRSDAFRFLILYKYGGLYFDLDVMFLRDLNYLITYEFCYAWESQPYANSAVLNLGQRSQIGQYLLEKSIVTGSTLPWHIFLYDDLELRNLYVLPCAFFDPIWQGLNPERTPLQNFPEFFKPFDKNFYDKFDISSFTDFFPGCYAYHWHNQWNVPEFYNSYFGIFELEFNKILSLN